MATSPAAALIQPTSSALGPSSVGQALGVASQNVAEEQQQEAPIIANMQKQMASDQSRVNQAAANVQPFTPTAAPTPPPAENALHQFASWSTAFALLASSFTHQPMVDAMNAMTAGINARRQGNIAAYQSAYQAWKDNTQLALERHQEEQGDLDNALKLLQSNVAAGTAALKAVGAQYGDSTLLAYTEAGDLIKVDQIAATRANTAAQVQFHYDQLQQEAQKAWQVVQVADPKNPKKIISARYNADTGEMTSLDGKTPMDPTGANLTKESSTSDRYATPDPTYVSQMASRVASGQAAMFTGYSATTPVGEAVNAAALKLNPNLSEATYSVNLQTQESFAKGPLGNSVQSLNVAVSHMDVLTDAITALQNGDNQSFNRVKNQIASWSGETAPNNFNAVKSIVADEISKAVLPGGGALADREALQSQLTTINSPQQLLGVVEQYQQLMTGQLSGLKLRYSQATGLNDFDDKLFPETIQKIERYHNSIPGNQPIGETNPTAGGPQPGAVEQGYRFNGGNPSDPTNWTKVSG